MFSSFGQSLCLSPEVTIVTVSAVEIISETLCKPHFSARDMLRILGTGLNGLLESFWDKALPRAVNCGCCGGVGRELPPAGMSSITSGAAVYSVP